MSNTGLIIEEKAADKGKFFDKEIIEKAKINWHEQNHEAFPLVPGDEEEYVPLP